MNLWLFTSCGPWLLALPGEAVLRLLLPDEANLDEGASVLAPDTGVGVLQTPEGDTPAFDLGRLLGLEDQHAAWVRLTLGSSAHRRVVAVRTGACASVAPLAESALRTLPPHLCRERRGALRAAFPVAAGPRLRRDEALGAVGLVLDLDYLLNAEESAWAETLA